MVIRDRVHASVQQGIVGAWCFSMPPYLSVRVRDQGPYRYNAFMNGVASPNGLVVQDGKMAFFLDGVDDYAAMPQLRPLDGATRYTFSAWVKPTDLVGVYDALTYRSISTSTPVFGIIGSNVGVWRFTVRDDASNIVNCTSTATANVWTHLSGVRDGNNLALYVNGVLANSQTLALGAITCDTPSIGNTRTTSNVSHFKGYIDDCIIHNRALASQEVAYLATRRGIAHETVPGILPRLFNTSVPSVPTVPTGKQ